MFTNCCKNDKDQNGKTLTNYQHTRDKFASTLKCITIGRVEHDRKQDKNTIKQKFLQKKKFTSEQAL